jgi:hypothetical protein
VDEGIRLLSHGPANLGERGLQELLKIEPAGLEELVGFLLGGGFDFGPSSLVFADPPVEQIPTERHGGPRNQIARGKAHLSQPEVAQLEPAIGLRGRLGAASAKETGDRREAVQVQVFGNAVGGRGKLGVREEVAEVYKVAFADRRMILLAWFEATGGVARVGLLGTRVIVELGQSGIGVHDGEIVSGWLPAAIV